jgi:hypothetical protein
MTADEEYAFVSKMLQNNGECRLPCWWGFTPGKTSWEATKTFFASRGQKIWGGGDNIQNYTIIFDTPGHYESYQSYIGKDGLLGMIGVSAVPPVGEDGYYAYGDPQFAKDWNSYLLPQMLVTYGQPAQIFLKTFSDTPAGVLPFSLLLFYPEQGILVQYYGLAEEEGEQLRICPWQSEISLWLWSPEREMTLADIGRVAKERIGYINDYLSLEEATGMSTEQFYQTFAQPASQACLETAADMW